MVIREEHKQYLQELFPLSQLLKPNTTFQKQSASFFKLKKAIILKNNKNIKNTSKDFKPLQISRPLLNFVLHHFLKNC